MAGARLKMDKVIATEMHALGLEAPAELVAQVRERVEEEIQREAANTDSKPPLRQNLPIIEQKRAASNSGEGKIKGIGEDENRQEKKVTDAIVHFVDESENRKMFQQFEKHKKYMDMPHLADHLKEDPGMFSRIGLTTPGAVVALPLCSDCPEEFKVTDKETDFLKMKTRLAIYYQFRSWIEDETSKLFVELEPSAIENAIRGQTPFAKGGFGDVYKAYINGSEVALKIPRNLNIATEKEAFHKEVAILRRIRHRNLVALKGACITKCALAYEFMPNFTLDERLSAGMLHLFRCDDRVQVAIDISTALVFLHATSPVPIVHGDLKPANVLFDLNMCAKLSDFGISRHLNETTLSGTPSHITGSPKGSGPYMDPEFAATRTLTPQSDIFAFGIVLLQLVTGQGASGLRIFISEKLECSKTRSEENMKKNYLQDTLS